MTASLRHARPYSLWAVALLVLAVGLAMLFPTIKAAALTTKDCANTAYMPPGKCFDGNNVQLVVSTPYSIGSLSNGLNAPNSIVLLYSTTPSATVTISSAGQCAPNGGTDSVAAAKTKFQVWMASNGTQKGYNQDDQYGRVEDSYTNKGNCSGNNQTFRLTSDAKKDNYQTLGDKSYYVWYFEASMLGSAVNGFQLNMGANDLIGYSNNSGDHFALQNRNPSNNSNLTDMAMPFAPSCGWNKNGDAPEPELSWFDDDWGNLQTNDGFSFRVLDTKTGNYVKFDNSGNNASSKSYNDSQKGMNGDGTIEYPREGNGNAGFVSLKGINPQDHYVWVWHNVINVNGIQFHLPFDSIFASVNCNNPPKGQIVEAFCDAVAGKHEEDVLVKAHDPDAGFHDSAGDGNAVNVRLYAKAGNYTDINNPEAKYQVGTTQFANNAIPPDYASQDDGHLDWLDYNGGGWKTVVDDDVGQTVNLILQAQDAETGDWYTVDLSSLNDNCGATTPGLTATCDSLTAGHADATFVGDAGATAFITAGVYSTSTSKYTIPAGAISDHTFSGVPIPASGSVVVTLHISGDPTTYTANLTNTNPSCRTSPPGQPTCVSVTTSYADPTDTNPLEPKENFTAKYGISANGTSLSGDKVRRSITGPGLNSTAVISADAAGNFTESGLSLPSAGVYTVAYSLTTAGGVPVQRAIGCPGSFTAYELPYVKAFDGDVLAGNGPSSSCGDGTSVIDTYNEGPGGGATGNKNAGSGTQLLAGSQDIISELVSGDLRSNNPPTPDYPTAPKGLTIANTDASLTYGGNSAMNNDCPDVSPPPNPQPYSGQISGNYSAVAPTVISNLTDLGDGNHLVLFVTGNVEISKNVSYLRAGLWKQGDDIPSVKIIATGNIYIDAGVTQLDGLYEAEGTIYTCGTGFSAIGLNEMYDTCNQQLTVNGAFVANSVQLMRSLGTLRNATTGETDSGPGGCDNVGAGSSTVTCAGEVFNFSPELYLAPSVSGGGTASTTYDAITSLPPIL